jgi:hypothetical protein
LGEIAAGLGVSRESLRLRVQQAQIEWGERDGLTGDGREELCRCDFTSLELFDAHRVGKH